MKATAKKAKKPVADRLRRIEGQVRGVLGMIEDERYCIDVLAQISAIHSALQRVEEEILRDHVHYCVREAFRSGDVVQQRNKVEELVSVVARMAR